MNNKVIKVLMFILMIVCLKFNNVYSFHMDHINFQNLTIDDGLSQSLVEYIYQDSLGYMWIGTDDGLNRFNGIDFKIYKNSKSDKNTISDDGITSIIEDSSKNLWIGSDNGLNKMDLLTGDIHRYLISEADRQNSNSTIEELMIDSKGRLIACTISSLNIYDSENDTFEQVTSNLFKDKVLQDFVEGNNGDIWIATNSGLYKYSAEENNIQQLNDIKDLIGNIDIFSLHYENNNLWLGTKTEGLIIINLEDHSVTQYKNNPKEDNSIASNIIRDILRAEDGSVWLATDKGLVLFDEESEKFYTYKKGIDKYSICDEDIISLYQDNTGVIWVGTFNGVSRFYINKNFKVYRNDLLNDNSLSSNSVRGIYEDDDEMIWVGTFNSGLNRINKYTGEITRYFSSYDENSLSSNRIRAITGIDNEIWIATDDGLNKYDKNTGVFKVYKESDNGNTVVNNDIRVVFIDKSGVLWIGTRGGLCTFDRKGTFTSYNNMLDEVGIYEKTISAIFEDSEGIMWIGFGNNLGIISYNRKNGQVKRYVSDENDLNSLSSNMVRCITEDSSGAIWIGTENGLNKFSKSDEKFITYTDKEGLSNNFIYGIAVDNNDNIWVSTNYGISMYDKENNNFIRYYEADGLSTNEFNGFSYHRNKDGSSIYFGGVNGLTEINPNNIKVNVIPNKVLIDYIKTSGGINIIERDNIKLEYDSRELYIRFFTPEYKSASQMQYAYKLEGFDSDWTFAGNENYARYASLDPGKYTMLIKGRNYNGVWSDITKVNINVKNIIWKTPYAYATYMIIITIIMYLICNEVKILEQLVTQRTLDLNNKLIENKNLYNKLIKAEKYKNNYFVNLSHELRTPLNVIVSIEQLISTFNKEGKEISKDKMESYMSALRGNSKRLLNLINNIIDTSKIESGSYRLDKETSDIVSIVEDTALSMVKLAEVKGIELIVDPEIEELYIECDKLDIERCITNLIGNSIKFTKEGGNIIVTISELSNQVKISVKDNGIGIDKEYHDSIFNRFGQVYNETNEEMGGSGLGLTLTKNLINLHGGEITVISEKGQGSEFIITLPLK